MIKNSSGDIVLTKYEAGLLLGWLALDDNTPNSTDFNKAVIKLEKLID